MKTIISACRRPWKLATPLALSALFILASCSKSGDDAAPDNSNGEVKYTGSFVKSEAQVTTSATGTVTATYHPANRELSYKLTWQGLTGNAVQMHFHDGPDIIIDISGFPAATSGEVNGSATLTEAQANDLAAGKLYAQIHTAQYPGGEVLATLAKTGAGGGNNNGGNGGNGGGGYGNGGYGG